MCCTLTRLLAAAPALALAAGAVVLTAGALGGRWTDAPTGSAVLTPPADAVAPAPAGLSAAATTRDWQEVAGSRSNPTYRP